MSRSLAVAGVLSALILSAGPAFAFQELPSPPPAQAPAKPKSTMAPMQLGSPATAPATSADSDRKGLNMFGYRIFPKLDFGLDLLYGEHQPQAQADLQPQPSQPQAGAAAVEEKGEMSLLGKLRRRF